MQIPVLVEPIANNGYRASAGEPLSLAADGASREAALAKLKELVQARLKNGAELVPVEVTPEPHPWMQFAGMFDPNDPLVQDWEKAMAEYRREVDEDPNYL